MLRAVEMSDIISCNHKWWLQLGKNQRVIDLFHYSLAVSLCENDDLTDTGKLIETLLN